jgi:hypothetical protein
MTKVGERRVARGKSRVSDWKFSPLAFGPVPLARTLAFATKALVSLVG